MITDGDVTLTESGAVVGVAVNRTYLGSKLNTQSSEPQGGTYGDSVLSYAVNFNHLICF